MPNPRIALLIFISALSQLLPARDLVKTDSTGEGIYSTGAINRFNYPVPQSKDTASFSSGVNLVGGGYFSLGDGIPGFEIGCGLFFNQEKWQAEVQAFGKFGNDKPDIQFALLGGRKALFGTKAFGVFSGGVGCEFENIEHTTPVYGNFGLVTGVKTTYSKATYWGAKLQVSVFETMPKFTIGQFAGAFFGPGYQSVEIGLSLTLGR